MLPFPPCPSNPSGAKQLTLVTETPPAGNLDTAPLLLATMPTTLLPLECGFLSLPLSMRVNDLISPLRNPEP